MKKEAIVILLEEKYQVLFDWLENQPDDNWNKSPDGKWTVGQQILHLVNSLQLLNKALSYPRFFLKYKFGLCNRELRNYKTIVEKYQQKLLENKDRTRAFNQDLKKPLQKDRERLITKLQIQNKKLQYKLKKISDVNLDTLVIPHPLMGKMTIREIIMWTAHHTEHHTESLVMTYSEQF
ncbi:DinB family protein [Polaribacter sp. SA4-12]|uniref:DinB family protein n=1 Tax=Polaribacter sp. SA4-12 TaxID=1312072 RepID=UPI000B3D19B4|nr:DinB family protein [Polaribacter sp. SA4-12]ARV13948.1 hypothetical protein BTO07_01770 [Polaribacter sp. SA4-12]